MRSVRLQFSIKSNNSVNQLFKVLSLVTNVRPRPLAPLTDGLVDDALPHGNEALH